MNLLISLFIVASTEPRLSFTLADIAIVAVPRTHFPVVLDGSRHGIGSRVVGLGHTRGDGVHTNFEIAIVPIAEEPVDFQGYYQAKKRRQIWLANEYQFSRDSFLRMREFKINRAAIGGHSAYIIDYDLSLEKNRDTLSRKEAYIFAKGNLVRINVWARSANGDERELVRNCGSLLDELMLELKWKQGPVAPTRPS